jgi:1,6-anhydro-N-acetylmuramate kinase
MQATNVQGPQPGQGPQGPQGPQGQGPTTIPGPPPAPVTIQHSGGSPRAVFEAARAKREVLGEYMSRLLNRRNNVAERLNNPNITPAEKAALEDHLREVNARIIAMEKQLEQAEAEVAAAAGVPGSTVAEPRGGGMRNGPPEEMLIIGTVFSGIALVIVAFAYARRLWRGAAQVVSQIPAAFEARLTRFEQSIDAMAIEIERVSEGQRFLTKVLAEEHQRALGAGAAEPIEVRGKVAEPVRRK